MVNQTDKNLRYIYIGHNKEEVYRVNFEPPLRLLDKQLALWKRRSLSLKGKVLIVKTLGISKFTFLSKVLHIPSEIKKEINSLLYRFIWNGKTEKVSRNIFMQPIEKGGYNMHDFHQVDKAIKVMWMKNIFKEKTFLCKKYLEIYSGVSNILVLLQSNFTENMIPNFDHLPDFYKDVIQNWKQVKYNNVGNNNEIRSQFIWYNSLIS